MGKVPKDVSFFLTEHVLEFVSSILSFKVIKLNQEGHWVSNNGK